MTTKPIVLDLAHYLTSQDQEILRKYVYIEWSGWALFCVALAAIGSALWQKRSRLEHDGIHWGKIGAICTGATLVLVLLFFIPYSVKVFVTPDLEALKSIFGV